MYRVIDDRYIVATGQLPRSPYNKQEVDFAIFVILKLPVHHQVILSHAFVACDEVESIDFRNRCELRFLPEEVIYAALDLVDAHRQGVEK